MSRLSAGKSSHFSGGIASRRASSTFRSCSNFCKDTDRFFLTLVCLFGSTSNLGATSGVTCVMGSSTGSSSGDRDAPAFLGGEALLAGRTPEG